MSPSPPPQPSSLKREGAKGRDFFNAPINKSLTITLVIFLGLFGLLIITELSLKILLGLGNPIIYDSNPLYGFRPLPNQETKRFFGAKIKINNLGLRAEADWDSNPERKILFLGDSVTWGGSRIDNQETFAHLAVKDLPQWQSGNGGVNAWGVENIYGLIVESNFTPAGIYVTTLTENDFYRGLTKIQGLPFYNVKPKYALLELWYYLCNKQNDLRYQNWEHYAHENLIEYVVGKAVKKLKEMDEFLKQRGCRQLIFITPYKNQVFENAPKDLIVNQLLISSLQPIYILDKLRGMHLTDKDRIFYDSVHLDKPVHEIWGKII